MAGPGRGRRPTRMMDLDDLCLLGVLKHLTPLPDLFHAAQCNQRLHRLCSGRRLFLTVESKESILLPRTESKLPPGAALDPTSRFDSLEQAVGASRPGSTILLKGGHHSLPSSLQVCWPLHFVGDGDAAEETTVTPSGACYGTFDFRASGKITNVTVRASHGPCVLHRSAALLLDRCLLVTHADRGLEHLVTPLVTYARGPRPSCQGRAAKRPRGAEEAGSSSSGRPSPGSSSLQIGPGVLSVQETRILGPGQAVQCGGSGCLKGVRVIYQVREPLFWFVVDSSDQGCLDISAELSRHSKRRCAEETGASSVGQNDDRGGEAVECTQGS